LPCSPKEAKKKTHAKDEEELFDSSSAGTL
jgi:hypothetical protein